MRGVCECALKSPLILGRHYDEENKMIAGRQPDSGNPTVRDERRALRKRDEGWCSNSHETGNDGYTDECLQPNHARAVILLDGSGRQGLNLAGESPVASITRFRCVVIPQFVLGNHTSIAWCISPSCLVAGVV